MADDYKGLRSPFAGTSPTNAASYQIKQELRQVYTNFLGIIKSCDSKEEQSGAGYVSVLPAVMQIDGEQNALPMAEIPQCPHTRLQQGIAAVIIDPVPGDIGVFAAMKNDSTNIKQGVTEPQRPGSLAEFSQSNSVMVGALHTKTPENWIALRQDKTREGYAPEGIKDKTDKDAEYTVGQNLIIQVGQKCTITIGADESVTISGNFTASVSGNADISVQGNCSLNVTGNATITAPQVTIDSPMTTVTGNMTIAGTLSQGEGGGGTATFGGTVTARGTVHSDADVTAGGISLNSHTHSGVEPGPGSTGGPQ